MDAELDILGTTRQVTHVRYSEDGKTTRGPFEDATVSIVDEQRDPFGKRMLIVNHKSGHGKTVRLRGAHAWIFSVTSVHPGDVQPSFAATSVCIRCPSSHISWVVASASAEDQRSFLDDLCAAGCVLADLQANFTLLPAAEQPTGREELRLGRPSGRSVRHGAREAEILALKIASDGDKMSQLLAEVEVLINLQHPGIVGARDRKSVV